MPFISSTERKQKFICGRKESYCCSNTGCKCVIRVSCANNYDPNNITFIEAVNNEEGNHIDKIYDKITEPNNDTKIGGDFLFNKNIPEAND